MEFYVDFGIYPPPPKDLKKPEDVDAADYLYQKPETGVPDKTLILMTRPELLYRRHINVGYVNGTVETLDLKTWTKRSDVLGLLKAKGIQPNQ